MSDNMIVENSLANPYAIGFNNMQKTVGPLFEAQVEQQRKADLASLQQNHDPKQILAMQLKYPELTGHIKSAFDQMDAGEQQRRVQETIPIYSAALSGRMDVAKKLLEKQKTALENSGGSPDEINNIQSHIDLAESDPTAFKNAAALSLSHGMGADKFGQTFVDLGRSENDANLAPYQQYAEQAKGNKDQAMAATQNAVLPYAAQTAEAELINKQNEPADKAQANAVNLMNAQNGQRMNALRGEELQQTIAAKQQEQQLKKIEAAKAFDTANSAMDVMNSTLNEALNHEALKKSNPYQRDMFKNLTGSPYLDYSELLKNIKSLNLPAALKGAKDSGWTGSMSDKDIEAIGNEIASLNVGLPNAVLEKHLKKIMTIINIAKARDMKYAKMQENVGALPMGTVQQQPASPPPAPQGVDPQQWAIFMQQRGQ